jgi:hypothetical protein
LVTFNIQNNFSDGIYLKDFFITCSQWISSFPFKREELSNVFHRGVGAGANARGHLLLPLWWTSRLKLCIDIIVEELADEYSQYLKIDSDVEVIYFFVYKQ